MQSIHRNYLILFVMAMMLIACAGRPSSVEVEQQITAKLLSGGVDKIFLIENFKKTNGVQNGDTSYTAVVEYDLVFRIGIGDFQKEISIGSNGSAINEFAGAVGALALAIKYGSFKAGDRVHKEEKVPFVKTDNGWMLSDDYQPSY